MKHLKEYEEAQRASAGVQSEGRAGGRAIGEDDQPDRAGVRCTPGAGQPVEKGNPGTSPHAV